MSCDGNLTRFASINGANRGEYQQTIIKKRQFVLNLLYINALGEIIIYL